MFNFFKKEQPPVVEAPRSLEAIREELRQIVPEIPADASAGEILDWYNNPATIQADNQQHLSSEDVNALLKLREQETPEKIAQAS